MNLTLSRKDKEFLEGKNGESARMAMEVLVELAKSYGASKLIDIKQAHIDGCSFAATGQAGLEFAEKLAEGGGKVRVPTTLNITSRDIKRWKDLHVVSWSWIAARKWFHIPIRAAQAFALVLWPLSWQYQVYYLCKKQRSNRV